VFVGQGLLSLPAPEFQVNGVLKMPKECPGHHSQYFYHASAYGLAGEIERPVRQSITAQAASTLASGGGRGTHRVEKFCVDPFICFDAAYTEVGGSFDECHNKHTTYACAVIESLNIADVVTADRVVSRMVTYSPELGNDDGEHSFDVTGSHFDNLRIAGHPIDVKLATNKLHTHDTYSKFEKAYHGDQADELLPWGNQGEKQLNDLEKLEEQYHALNGIGKRAKLWKKGSQRPKGGAYWCSAAGHLDLRDQVKETELQGFGGIIVIPKFGVVRLAQMLVHKDYRRLTMFHVQMCSGSTGSSDGGGTTTGGTRPYP
jgi:hypothetical protein